MTQLGISKVLLACATVSVFFWGLLYLSYEQFIGTTFALMFMYFVLIGWFLGLFFTASLSGVTPKDLPGKKYVLFSGGMATSYGVGGVIFTLLYYFALDNDLGIFFWILGGSFLITGLFASYQYKMLETRTQSPRVSLRESSRESRGTGENALLINEEEEKPASLGEAVWNIAKELLLAPRFWSLYFFLLINLGIGATYAANIGMMGVSQGKQGMIAGMEINFALSQAVGRLAIQAFNSFRVGVHRSFAMVPVGVLATVGCLVAYLVPHYSAFHYVVSMVGICYGASWGIAAVSVILLPNGHIFSAVWAFLATSAGIGALSISAIVGMFYDNVVPEGEKECFGEECFLFGNLFMTCMAAFSALLGVGFWLRVRNLPEENTEG